MSETNLFLRATSILPPLQHHFECLDLLSTTNLEWTLFINGIFLDYYALPHIKSHLSPNTIAIDITHRKAALPGSGEVPVTFTYTYDLARFVVAALDLPEGTWERESRVVGDTVTWKQFVALAEEILGEKFEVAYDDVEKLKKFEVTELPGHVALYERYGKDRLQWFLSIFELWTTDETSWVRREGSLNERFPEIGVIGVRVMLEKYWAKR